MVQLGDVDHVLEGARLGNFGLVRRPVLPPSPGVLLGQCPATPGLLVRASRPGQGDVEGVGGQSLEVVVELVGGHDVIEAEADPARVVRG